VDWPSVRCPKCGDEFTVEGCVPLSEWHDHPFRKKVAAVERENK
jgi:hypothetical protein